MLTLSHDHIDEPSHLHIARPRDTATAPAADTVAEVSITACGFDSADNAGDGPDSGAYR